jgi:hypothetical protein
MLIFVAVAGAGAVERCVVLRCKMAVADSCDLGMHKAASSVVTAIGARVG